MPESGFYDHNDHIAYPLLTDSDFSLMGGGVLPRRGLVDAGFMLGIDSQFVPITHKVTLYSVERSGPNLLFDFRSDAPGFASDYRWLFTVPVTAEIGCIVNVDASSVLLDIPDEDRGTGFIVVGVLSDIIALGGGIHQLANPPEVEPALLQSLVNTFSRSMNVANQARRCPPICNESPPPPTAATTFALIQSLTGALQFKEGWNSRIIIDEDDNSIELGGVLGAGEGKTCEDIIIDEGGVQVGEECASCDDYIRTFNGRVIPSGKMTLSGGAGVTVVNDPDNHRITVTLEDNRHCLEEVDPTPIPSSSSSS